MIVTHPIKPRVVLLFVKIRVGYEDGPFLSSGERARSNAELVEEVANAARSVGREVVAPDKARMIMGIN